MARRIRWQIVLALAGTLFVVLLTGTAALLNAAGSLPLTGNVYVEGVIGTPRQLNPLLLLPNGPPSERDLAALLFNGLTRPGPDGQPQPALAERWAISPDATAYTFTLRSGLRWHDGAPLTADDVAWTLNAVRGDDFPGDPALRDIWRNVRVTALDARRIECVLSEPFAPFLAATMLPILPAHVLRDVPPSAWADQPFSRAPIGSGPFRLEQLTTGAALLRPFEGAANGRPALDLVVLRFFANAATANDALRWRDVQGVATTSAAPTSRTLRSITTGLDEYTILTFNVTDGLLADQAVRRTLAEGLDRDALARAFGPARTLETPILPDTWAAAPGVALPPFDPTAAAANLDALGWTRGPDGLRRRDDAVLRLPLLVADDAGQRRLAAAIAAQWEALGLVVEVQPLATAALNERLVLRDFSVVLQTWRDVADPDLFPLWHSSQAQGGANYAGLDDPELDELLVEGRITLDPAQRRRIYGDVQRRWAELVPGLPLFQPQLVLTYDERLAPTGLANTLSASPAGRWASVANWTMGE